MPDDVFYDLTSATDSSLMHFGQHKGSTLTNVPAQYLVWWYEEAGGDQKLVDPNSDGMLARYIKENYKYLELELDEYDL